MVHYNSANAFETVLTANMGPTDLIASVQSTTGGPSSPCIMVIDPNDPAKREYILFNGAFTGTSFVTSGIANRYLAGSAATSGITHSAGATVRYAFTKQDYDNLKLEIDNKLPLTGGTLTGDIVLANNPTISNHPATKIYVDTLEQYVNDLNTNEVNARTAGDALKVNKAGDTMTGALVLPGNPTTALQASPKQYVDSLKPAFRGAKVYPNVSYSIADSIEEFPDFTNAIFDTWGIWDVGWADRFTIPADMAGYWDFLGAAAWDLNTSGYRLLRIRKNSYTTGDVLASDRRGSFSATEQQVTTGPVFMAAGEWVSMGVYQNSGGPLNVLNASPANLRTMFAATFLGI